MLNFFCNALLLAAVASGPHLDVREKEASNKSKTKAKKVNDAMALKPSSAEEEKAKIRRSSPNNAKIVRTSITPVYTGLANSVCPTLIAFLLQPPD